MQLKNLHQLFVLQIKDLYSAETQLFKSLPKMAKKANSTSLTEGFLQHLEQTKEQVDRLDEIADNLEFNPKGHVCKAIKGLIEESEVIINAKGNPHVLDAGLIASALRIEYYEISAYKTAISFAELMSHNHEVSLLNKSLIEEEDTSMILDKLGIDEVFVNALDSNQNVEAED